jgi:hypothetical protein
MSCSLHGLFETFEKVQVSPTNQYLLSHLVTAMSLNKEMSEKQGTSSNWSTEVRSQLISFTCNLDSKYKFQHKFRFVYISDWTSKQKQKRETEHLLLHYYFYIYFVALFLSKHLKSDITLALYNKYSNHFSHKCLKTTCTKMGFNSLQCE